ncbi:MAG TPA: hypothetical protein VMB47_10240 [Candidatus Aquilonibacter sp.]|nr:hypothetical protein [Candidatus Aquilonibacter sp.]
MRTIILQYMKKYAKKAAIPVAMLAIISAAVATAQPASPADRPAPRQLRLVLAPRSTADPFEVTKHFSQSCPNVTITRNEHESDFMLYAGGWSGDYRFMVIKKGGDVLYTTETALLSNSVKNVCKFLNTRM